MRKGGTGRAGKVQPKQNAVDPNKIKPWPESVTLQFTPSGPLTGDGIDARGAREMVGREVQSAINADEQAKGELTDFYREIDLRWLGRDADVIEVPWEGAPTFNLQTMRNKIDQAVAFCILPHAKSNPHFLIREGGPQGSSAEAVERVLQHFLGEAEYVLKLAQAVSFVFRRGSCPIKAEYVPSTESTAPTIKLTPIDLQWFRHYPDSAETFQEATLVGDVIQVKVSYVERRQRSGEYFADQRIGPGQTRLLANADPGGDKQSTGSNSVYTQDDTVDLFVGLMSRDWDDSGVETWHEVVVAIDQATLLYEQPFGSKAYPYSDLFVHKESGRNYNESCMGGLLIDPHDWINYSSDSQGWLQHYATMPAMIAVGATAGDDVIETRPGLVIPMEDGASVYKAGGDVNLGAYPVQIALGRQVADETSRVSQNGLGSNLKADTTATEAQQVAAGQATGIEAYQYLGLCFGMVRLAKNILALLAENFEDWYGHYVDVLPIVEKADFEKPYHVEVNGQTPINTPAAIAAQATQLMSAYAQVAQIQPDLPQRFPDLIPELLRSLIESTTLPNKSKILPSREAQMRREQEIEELRNGFAQTLDGIAQAAEGASSAGGAPVDQAPPNEPGTPANVQGVNAVIPGIQSATQESEPQG